MSDMKKDLGCVIVASAIGIPCLLCGGCLLVGMSEVHPTSHQATPTVDHSPAKQEGRERLIAKLRANGVFSRIESRGGSLVRAWTGPAFDALDFQDKERFTGVVYAYYFGGSSFADAVVLHDGRTGKEIGTMQVGWLTMK